MEAAAQRVLAARAAFPASTLADLYDPLAMPPALTAAHTALDKAVDRCYRSEAFPTDRARVEHLFALYEKLSAPLAPTARTKTKRATKGLYSKGMPTGKSTPQSEADAAHFHYIMEEPPPYRTD